MARNFTSLGKGRHVLLLFLLTFSSFIFSRAQDVTKPTVVSVSPWLTVDIGTIISAQFSETMNPATINSNTVELFNALNGAKVSGVVTYNASAKKAILYPSSPLTSLLYVARVKGGSSGVKDLAGNAMANDFTWAFVMIPLTDLTAPTILTVSPSSGATNVSNTTQVTVDFSEAMKASTIKTSTIELRNNASNALITSTVSYNASLKRAILTPSSPLAGGTVYKAIVKGGSSGVNDAYGNDLAGNYQWTFTTAGGDNIAPLITSVSPVNGAADMATDCLINAVFNEAINPSTVNSSTVQLVDDNYSPVASTISYNAATKTVTITPSAPLSIATIYSAKVKGGSSGVKDVAGNALASDRNWSFSTIPISVFNVTAVPASSVPVGNPVEIGVKFRSSKSGYIRGIRFYKVAENTGNHIGHLWSSSGAMLGEATFVNESASGWQQVLFNEPVAINANEVYVASYFSPGGMYGYTYNYFYFDGLDNGPLHILSDTEAGGNGVYMYSPTPTFPSQSFLATNYFVDVLFVSGAVTALRASNEPVITNNENPPAPPAINQEAEKSAVKENTMPPVITEKILIKAMPNPSAGYFNIGIYSSDASPVTVRVMDVSGRVIEVWQKVNSNILQMGQNWRTGSYFVEVVQGNERKVITLLKVN